MMGPTGNGSDSVLRPPSGSRQEGSAFFLNLAPDGHAFVFFIGRPPVYVRDACAVCLVGRWTGVSAYWPMGHMRSCMGWIASKMRPALSVWGG